MTPLPHSRFVPFSPSLPAPITQITRQGVRNNQGHGRGGGGGSGGGGDTNLSENAGHA